MRPLSDGSAHPYSLSLSGGLLLGLLIALTLLSACTLWPRQDLVSRGQSIYANLCVSCHGDKGDRVRTVRLFSKQFLEARSDESLEKTITEGNAIMLPFGKAKGGPLSEEEIRAVVRYLRARAGAAGKTGVAKRQPTATSSSGASSTPLQGGEMPMGGLTASKIYAKYCVFCHGEKGMKVASAPLADRNFVARLGQEGLTRVISQGKGAMPAWGKAKGGPLSRPEIAGLAAYILAVASTGPPTTPAPPVAKAAATPTPTAAPIGTPAPASGTSGSPGKALYDQFCAGCHPIITAIAPRASKKVIMRCAPGITEGQADIIMDFLRSPELWSGQATAKASGSPTPGPAQAALPPKATGGPPPKLPHSLEGKEGRCLDCHGRGTMAPYPVGHTGRTVQTCLLCHEISPKPAPPMAHALGDRAGRCLICHGPGGGASRVPTSHAGRGTDTCIVCH
jgi:mono/diheme cytochrome c family protein